MKVTVYYASNGIYECPNKEDFDRLSSSFYRGIIQMLEEGITPAIGMCVGCDEGIIFPIAEITYWVKSNEEEERTLSVGFVNSLDKYNYETNDY